MRCASSRSWVHSRMARCRARRDTMNARSERAVSGSSAVAGSSRRSTGGSCPRRSVRAAPRSRPARRAARRGRGPAAGRSCARRPARRSRSEHIRHTERDGPRAVAARARRDDASCDDARAGPHTARPGVRARLRGTLHRGSRDPWYHDRMTTTGGLRPPSTPRLPDPPQIDPRPDVSRDALQALRGEFLYFNVAGSGPTFPIAHRAADAFRSWLSAVGMFSHVGYDAYNAALDATRADLAAAVGDEGGSSRIALAQSATDGLNTLVAGLRLDRKS